MSEEKNICLNKLTVAEFVKKLIDNDEEKVRNQCHVTGKFRGAVYWDCNIEKCLLTVCNL